MPVKECGGISRGEVKKEGVGIITRFVGVLATRVLLNLLLLLVLIHRVVYIDPSKVSPCGKLIN